VVNVLESLSLRIGHAKRMLVAVSGLGDLIVFVEKADFSWRTEDSRCWFFCALISVLSKKTWWQFILHSISNHKQ
jgi:hypothetical protein